MKNRTINAVYDFTEQDQVLLGWLKRKEAASVRGELIPGKQITKIQVKDKVFIAAVVTVLISFLMVLAAIWLG